ncbi:ATP-dependent bile acid permease [Mycena kentingensis (nom. inval.)]|nr:ATP-dependent bile acid permease [Mycena kentingensis (nom. inval.)]
MLPRIPDEIIAEFLSPALKVSEADFSETSHTSPFATFGESTSGLLVVCKAWLRVATPLLYHTVVLRSKAQAVALQKALHNNEELRPFVKKLRVEGAFGTPMRGVLQHATKITDLFLSVCIWSNDTTAGLCAGLDAINPTRLIIYDSYETGKNKQSDALLKKVVECLRTWSNLKILEIPYPLETIDNDYISPRSSALFQGIKAADLLEELRAPMPLSNYENTAMNVLEAVASCPSMKRIVLWYYLPELLENSEVAASIRAHEKLKNLVVFRPSSSLYSSAEMDQTFYAAPPHPDFAPLLNATEEAQDRIWGRVLFFAMAIPELDQRIATDIYRVRTEEILLLSDNLDFILVCKKWKAVGLRHLYRHVKLYDPGDLTCLSEALQHPTHTHLNLVAEIRSLSIGPGAVWDVNYTYYSPDFNYYGQQSPERCVASLAALETVLQRATNIRTLNNGGIALYPPSGPIEEEIPILGWNAFETVARTLQTVCGVRFAAAKSVQSPLIFESFAALRQLEWSCTTEFRMSPGEKWKTGALPRLESLSLVKWHPSFLDVLVDSELPSLRRLYFLVDMNGAQSAAAGRFLESHRAKLTELRVNVADKGDLDVLELCPELPLLMYGNGDPTVDDDDERARIKQPNLSIFKPRIAHENLKELVLCLPVSAHKEINKILGSIQRKHLPALKTVQLSNEYWPITEHEISKNKIIPAVEALLKTDVSILDANRRINMVYPLLCASDASILDFGDACIRGAWAAIVPFAAVVAFCLLALPVPAMKPFLTLREIEDEEEEPLVSLWRARVFAVVGLAQCLAWAALAVMRHFDEGGKELQLTLVAGAWLYSAIRSIATPPRTVPYDFFTLYSLQAVGGLLVFGGYLFDYMVGDAPLPSTRALFGLAAYEALVVALLVLVLGMHMNVPFRSHKQDQDVMKSPEDYTTLFEWITFSFIHPLIRKGSQQTLYEQHVWEMSPTMQSRPVFAKFQTILGISLLQRLVVANSFDLMQAFSLSDYLGSYPHRADFIGTLLSIVFQYASPYLLKRLLELLDEDKPGVREIGLAHIYAGLMFVCALLRAQCNLQHLWFNRRASARVRSQLMAAIYDKALKRKDFSGSVAKDGVDVEKETEEQSNAAIGKIVNMLNGDAERISTLASTLYLLYGAPFEIIIGTTFLYQLLGWSAFIGFIPLIAVIPAQKWLTVKGMQLYDGQRKAADRRMGLVDELISAVRLLKLFAWEDKWTERVMAAREKEIEFIVQRRFFTTIFNGVWNFGPLAHSLLTFTVYVWLGNELTVAKAFTAIAIFSTIRNPLNVVPWYIAQLLEGVVALKRITTFLREDEVTEQVSTLKQSTFSVHHEGLGLEKATLEWNHAHTEAIDASSESTSTFQPDHHFQLKDISVLFPKGKLSVVTGPTASGKTALLMALLGEMTLLPTGGRVIMRKDPSASVDENGHTHGLAYAAQAPWLQHRSIKENILFGSPFEEERYREAIRCCALQPDLDLLEDGDETEIGFKGISLSGGQKARVALARADSHTSRFLYENCIRGPLLANRTVILVTHHVDLVLPGAHYLVGMLDGRINTQGTVSELRAGGLLEEMKHEGAAVAEKEEKEAVALIPAEMKMPRKLVEDEHREVGVVKWGVYNAYLIASGYSIWVLLALLATLQNVQRISEKLWFKIWSEAYRSSTSAFRDASTQIVLLNIDTSSANKGFPDATQQPFFYIGVYGAIGVLGVALQLLGGWVQYTSGLRASRVLFKKLSLAVIGATFRFHDTTPQGRLLNRFGKDFATVDGELSGSIYALSSSFSGFLVSIFTVAYVFIPVSFCVDRMK